MTGQDAGITHLELTDVDGKTETFDIIVQADVEFLRIQLKRMFPTANITPVPISNNFIIPARRRSTTSRTWPARLNLAATAFPGVTFINELTVAGDQQVQLCVTVAQVSRSELRSMAFDFLTDSKNFFFGSTVGGAVAQPAAVGIGSSNLNVTGLGGQVLSGVPGCQRANLLFGVIHNRWGFLGFLQALRTEGVVKSLNEPTVTTMSGRPASFLVGGEQAIPVPAGLGQVGVQFEEFGTRLNFVPIVLGNGKIHLEVEPEVSSLNAADGTSIDGAVVPGRTTTAHQHDGRAGGRPDVRDRRPGPAATSRLDDQDAGPGRPAVPRRGLQQQVLSGGRDRSGHAGDAAPGGRRGRAPGPENSSRRGNPQPRRF